MIPTYFFSKGLHWLLDGSTGVFSDIWKLDVWLELSKKDPTNTLTLATLWKMSPSSVIFNKSSPHLPGIRRLCLLSFFQREQDFFFFFFFLPDSTILQSSAAPQGIPLIGGNEPSPLLPLNLPKCTSLTQTCHCKSPAGEDLCMRLYKKCRIEIFFFFFLILEPVKFLEFLFLWRSLCFFSLLYISKIEK